ncbi:MAG TPA: GNAT family N-acetyltransferase [Gemmatimonadaceae bacterium]|jgi:ribosomal protein S18 acetylase RimI-like enzyme
MGQVRASKYVAGWPRATDFGVVAEDERHLPLGAAWCRFFEEHDSGYGFVASDVPELTIGVASDARGQGVGTALMQALLVLADDRGCRAVSLSVEDGNEARRLYERTGFVVVGRNGGSDTLLRSRVIP